MAVICADSAAGKVLQTYELLEPIILHLSPLGVMLATRVCTAWRGGVERSKPIRELLLLQPLEIATARRKSDQSPPDAEDASDKIAELSIVTSRPKINYDASTPWLFRETFWQGSLFVYRDPETEVYIFAPHTPATSHRPLKVLDQRYMQAQYGGTYSSIEWRDRKGKRICGEEYHGYEARRSTLKAYLKTFWSDEDQADHRWQLIGRSTTVDTKGKTESGEVPSDNSCQAM